MADFIPDGPNRLLVEPPGSGNTQFDVKRDIYSAWKRWVLTGAGAGFPPAFSVEGGTPIGATGIATGQTQILTNGWKIIGAGHDHILRLTGNLYSDDGVPTVPTPGFSVTIEINNSAAAQGVNTGGTFLAADRAALERIQAATAGRAVVAADGRSVVLYAEDGVTVLRTLDISADSLERSVAP